MGQGRKFVLISPQNVHKKQGKKTTTLWLLIIFHPNENENAVLLKCSFQTYFFLLLENLIVSINFPFF